MHHGAIASVTMGEEALLLRQHEHKICGGAHLGSAFVSVQPHDELAMQARAHRGRFFVLKRLCARLIYNLLRTIFSSSQTHTHTTYILPYTEMGAHIAFAAQLKKREGRYQR
jgi:hypothetical protein